MLAITLRCLHCQSKCKCCRFLLLRERNWRNPSPKHFLDFPEHSVCIIMHSPGPIKQAAAESETSPHIAGHAACRQFKMCVSKWCRWDVSNSNAYSAHTMFWYVISLTHSLANRKCFWKFCSHNGIVARWKILQEFMNAFAFTQLSHLHGYTLCLRLCTFCRAKH